jgi:signal transduction protein with GAF and PtsI domain
VLDMFAYLSQDSGVRFVFVATSVKVDVVDSFEKRIKSRFSHRMALLYEQDLPNTFMGNLQTVFNSLLQEAQSDGQRQQINALQAIVISTETENALQQEFDFGK